MTSKNKELLEEAVIAIYAKDKLEAIEELVKHSGDQISKADIVKILNKED